MSNTRELRRRIRSVKNTSQITKAMQMVAATKMRRAQNQAENGRPYNTTLHFALESLLSRVEEGSHPLMQFNESTKAGVILLSTNKSLCGALNTNLFRTMQSFLSSSASLRGVHPTKQSLSDSSPPSHLRAPSSFVFYTIGKKGRDFVVKTGRDLAADFENHEVVTFRTASQLAKIVVQAFLSKEIGQVYLAYPDFVSALRQEPKITKLLPLDMLSMMEIKAELKDLDEQEATKIARRTEHGEKKSPTSYLPPPSQELLFEPAIADLLEYTLMHAVETKIYQAMLETKASEHSARMIAMQNATDNAKELVSDLELSYNRTRQEGITRELLEITSAGAALE